MHKPTRPTPFADEPPADVYHEPANFFIFVAIAAGMLGLFVVVLILVLMAG